MSSTEPGESIPRLCRVTGQTPWVEKGVLMSDTETAAESDHRLLPPLTGAGDEEAEAELVETAEDLENLEDDAPGGVAPV